MNIERCRVCHSDNLEPIKDLGEYHYQVLMGEEAPIKTAPLRLVFCADCLHLQLAGEEVVVSQNWFYSGETRTMRSYFRELSVKIENRFHLKPKDVVVDIGSNDGTFLRTFDIPNLVRVGIEQADELVDEAKTGLDYFIHRPWSARVLEQVVGRKAKFISALNVLEQVDDPIPFLRDIEASLTEDGICLLQLTSIKCIVDHLDVGFFSLDKPNYYSLTSLNSLLQNAQLEIFDMEQVVIGGNALRLYCRKKNSYVENENGAQEIEDYLEFEKTNFNPQYFNAFFVRLADERKRIKDFLSKCEHNKRKIWIYGLSDRSAGMIHYLNLKADDVQGIYDWQEKRLGLKQVQLGQIVQSEEALKLAHPDFFFLTPYHYINEFYQKETDARRSGAQFILPFPKFRVVS